MSKCGCNSNSGNQVLTPNFSCAPDLSQLLFRFVERKSMGIVKGNDESGVINMSDFFIPVDSYSMGTIKLCQNDYRKIELGSTQSKGPRRQEYEFVFDNSVFTTIDINQETSAKIKIFDGIDELAETSFFPAPDFDTFIENLKTSLPNNFKQLSSYNDDDDVSVFSLKAKDSGKEYNYQLILRGSRSTHVIVTFLVDASNQTPNAQGAYISGDFTNNTSVAMQQLGNEIYAYSIELEIGQSYNYIFEYGLGSPETVPGACATNGFRTITVSNQDTILDIVCFGECDNTNCPPTGSLEPTLVNRALIDEIQTGTEILSPFRYNHGAFKVLLLYIQYCQDCSEASERFIEYTDASDVDENGLGGATWKKIGNMILLSGTDDDLETDTNLIENIYIRNTQECGVNIQKILAI